MKAHFLLLLPVWDFIDSLSPAGNPGRAMGFGLVVILPNLEEGLGMVAHGADLGSGNAQHQVAAVAALPQGDAALFKHLFGLHVVQQAAYFR